MDGRNHDSGHTLTCTDCRGQLQEYLDGTLDKTASVELFLHLRGCEPCQQEHVRLQTLFGLLESLPEQPVPADFDAPILESIPLEAYRAMEPIRRERVPVYLEEEALPAFVRAPGVRLGGVVIAAAAAVAVGLAQIPAPVAGVGAVGLLPELLVRLQGWARRATLATRRAAG